MIGFIITYLLIATFFWFLIHDPKGLLRDVDEDISYLENELSVKSSKLPASPVVDGIAILAVCLLWPILLIVLLMSRFLLNLEDSNEE